MNLQDLENVSIKNLLLAFALVGGSALVWAVLSYIFIGF